MKKTTLYLVFLMIPVLAASNLTEKNKWRIKSEHSIVLDLTQSKHLPYHDDIEMSGRKVSAIIDYSISETGQLKLTRDIIFPQLRTFNKSNEPDWREYRAYLRRTYGSESEPRIAIENRLMAFSKVDSVEISGELILYHAPIMDIILVRTLMPSMSKRLLVEKWELINTGTKVRSLYIGQTSYSTEEMGVKGLYCLRTNTDAPESITLSSGERSSFALYFSASLPNEPINSFDVHKVEQERDAFLDFMQQNLILKTPDTVLNTLFYFSKIRVAESIFNSKMGVVHSPGGGNYYTGVWANDQAEYSGPFFPFLGYPTGIEAAYNAYKMFLHHIPKDNQPIFSSFEMEGDLPCCGKDRGDAAMIAYGGSQFLLRMGAQEMTQELWPLIEWCLEYCHRKLNEEGVVKSTTDEMEGRISTGDANLATSSLYYGGLKSASYLAQTIGKQELATTYNLRREQLNIAIENHFGYKMEDLDTYRYFEGNTHLRHWICLPLVVGINTRKEATAKALLDKLWTENGVLVELNPDSKNKNVFWDRGTLYAFRGILKAGMLDKTLYRFQAFSAKRLIGDRVPYVIEAYPENYMRHLSAESALYCRVFIEGLLGYEQTGYRTFIITPQLTDSLPELIIDRMHVSNHLLTFDLKREKNKIHTRILCDGKMIFNQRVENGKTIEVRF